MSLGLHSTCQLQNLLATVGRGEKDLEYRRQRVCKMYNFHAADVFNRLDKEGTGHINGADLLAFVRDFNNFYFSQEDCDQLVQFFDCNADGVLDCGEFQQMLLCCEDEHFKKQALERPSLDLEKGKRMPVDLEFAVLQILEGELNLLRRVNQEKRLLSYGVDYTPEAAFEAVDISKTGKIDVNDLRAFLKYEPEGNLQALIRRIDLDSDNILTTEEWAQFMGPAAPRDDAPSKDQAAPLRPEGQEDEPEVVVKVEDQAT
jgi:Ca2+-binding EF-hand superfamily protein